MTYSDDFDDLYKDVRDQLLLEAYALTGDLGVSRTAVRDALAVAWHHWDKVRYLDDKVGYLRPLVWNRARHRHNARPWHKEKEVPVEVAATLDALATLSLPQRKALVLHELADAPIAEIAREVGVPVSVAAEHLAAGRRELAQALDVPEAEIRSRLEALASLTQGGRWPRSNILRRAGTARRRTHTLVGVVGTVVAIVLSGMVVAQGETVDATLGDQGFERRATKVEADEDAPTLSPDVLLKPGQVRRIDRKLDWVEADTHDNEAGDGLVLPCQQARFADPERLGALVRFFDGSQRPARGGGKKNKPKAEPKVAASVIESVELSASEDAAGQAYSTAQRWFGGCTSPRTQLLSVHELPGVGDEAQLFTLRSWSGPTRTIHVGVARSGQLLTTTVDRVSGFAPAPKRSAGLLAAAVNAACGSPGSGACASPPRIRTTKVPVAGTVPGMLSEFDLPPVSGATGPWVGTTAEPATSNLAATRCDRTSFAVKGLNHSLTRTFLFPRDNRTDEFGLTQSVAMARNPKAARQFVAKVRDQVGRCAQEGFGTDVSRIYNKSTKKLDLTVWRLELAISDQESVEFLMAIMRDGKSVSQLGFSPTRDRSVAQADFIALSQRALTRLPRLRLEDE